MCFVVCSQFRSPDIKLYLSLSFHCWVEGVNNNNIVGSGTCNSHFKNEGKILIGKPKKKFRNLSIPDKFILKFIFVKYDRCGLDSTGSGLRPMRLFVN
jgi:hypothetical protein